MKSYKKVQKTRIDYHNSPSENTVHRSSLLVPKLEGTKSNISFVNHFLIKRNIEEVSLKISATTKNGALIRSITLQIDEPRVYSIFLDDFFEDSEKVSLFIIEFYSVKNLFIPFPAVMINHVGKDFVNCVHSYNRVVNDIFEDEEVNQKSVSESSFDVLVDNQYDTFFNLVSGPFKIDDNLNLSLKNNAREIKTKVSIKQDRLSSENYYLGDLLKTTDTEDSLLEQYKETVNISQPKQSLFYGRLLSGIINKKTKSFSANHSYYDSSSVEEYFDNQESFRAYPFFSECTNRVLIYPINSPSIIKFHVEVFSENKVFKSKSYILKSPSEETINLEINEIVKLSGFKNVSLYKLVAKSKGNIPTRVTHQLIFGPLNSKSKLYASIAINLANKEIYIPKNKKGLCWGQILIDRQYRSFLGISFNDYTSSDEIVEIAFYGLKGKLKTIKRKITCGSSIILNNKFFNELNVNNEFIWYIARSKRPDLSAKSFHYNIESHNGSGEHSF